MNLSAQINQTSIADGQIAIFSLAQAGYLIKTAHGLRLAIDPYLSDSCERLFGFKRLVPPVISAAQLQADLFICTHAHADHLDQDSLPVIANYNQTYFIGAPDCQEGFGQAGLDKNRYTLLAAGQQKTIQGIAFRATYADHGDLAPDAVGFVIIIDGITIYLAGDTAYQPEKIGESVAAAVDIMIAPINGAFGNLNEKEACLLAQRMKPKVLIGGHFGMFIEHGGSPKQFLEAAQSLTGILPVILAPGERLIYTQSTGAVSCQTCPVNAIP